MYNYNPIQLLRPPGLCKLVCPILTSSNSSSLAGALGVADVGKVADRLGWESRRNGSSLSAIGLGGAPPGNDGVCTPLGGSSKSSLLLLVRGTDKNDSACHSYQTCFSVVRRQIETCSSEPLGRYSGSWHRKSERRSERSRSADLEREEQWKPAEHIF